MTWVSRTGVAVFTLTDPSVLAPGAAQDASTTTAITVADSRIVRRAAGCDATRKDGFIASCSATVWKTLSPVRHDGTGGYVPDRR